MADSEDRHKITFDTNAKKVTTETNKLGKSINEVDDAAQGVSKTQGKLKKSMADTTDEVTKNGGAIAILNKLTDGYAQNVKDAWEAMVLFGKESKIGMGIQKAYTFVMGTSTGAMKAFKIALISTGLGAIALALVTLIVRFGEVKDAVYKFIPALKIVGDFFGKIIDAVTDFVGITSDATRAMDKMNESASKMLDNNKELLASYGDQLSEFQKKQVDIAKTLADRIKEITEDELLSVNEKNDRIKLAQDRAKRELLKNIEDTNAEAQRVRDEAHAKKLEDDAKKQDEAFNAWLKKQDEQKKIIEELREDDEKRWAEANEAIAEWEEEQEEEETDAEDDRLDRLAEASRKKIKIAEDELEGKKQVDAALKDLGNQGVAAAKDLFAKNKKVQKGIIAVEGAVALGKLGTGVVEQVGKDNTASPLTFGMPWSGIHIAQGVLGAASIVSNTNKQLQALGGGGSISAGSTNIPRPQAAPTVAFNNTAENQIGQSIASAQVEQPPIKVYVAESEMSEAQTNVKALVDKNTF